MAEVAHCSSDPTSAERVPAIDGFAAEEIGAALCLTRRAADSHLGLALDLFERLPAVGEALRRGLIDLARARVICESTCSPGGDRGPPGGRRRVGAGRGPHHRSTRSPGAAAGPLRATRGSRRALPGGGGGTAGDVPPQRRGDRRPRCLQPPRRAGGGLHAHPRRRGPYGEAGGGSPQHRPVAQRPPLGPPRWGPLHQGAAGGGRPPHRPHHPRRARLQPGGDPRVRADRGRRRPPGGRRPARFGVAGHRHRPGERVGCLERDHPP